MKKCCVSLAALAAVAVFSLGPTAYAQLFQAPTGPDGKWNVYQLVTEGATWKDADIAAKMSDYEGTSGNLLAVNSELENMWVHRKGGGGDIWLGLTDREFAAPPNVDGNGNPTPQEAGSDGSIGWAWTTGDSVTFTAWGGGEPNDWNAGDPGEDVAHIRSDGLWNDHKSSFGADEPMTPMLQPGTSGDETGGPSLKYVIEYPTASADQIPGVDAGVPSILPAPMPGPAGGTGYWGILEVRGVNTGGSIQSVVNNLLTNPPPAEAQIFTGTSPILDFTDPETNADGGPMLTTAPIPYLSNTPEDDNEIHGVAKATLKAVESGDYTLQVRSDDGFALKVHGAAFSSVSGGGQIDPLDPSVMFFPAGTGDSNTRGVINLPAGEYPVEFVWWEGGAGSYYEVTSAKGAFTDTGYTQWLALGDPSRVETAPAVARLVAPANVINGPDAENIPDTIAAIRSAIKDPDAPRGTADTVMLIGAADENPCCGRPSENLPRDLLTPFPNGGGDDYTAGVFGTFLVDDGDGDPGETLQLTFGLFTDDGVALHIFGESFIDKGANGELVALDGDTMVQFDDFTGNSNTYGLIELEEGTYGFEAFLFEGGGGSGLEIFVGLGDQRDAYNVGTFSPLSINPESVFVNQGLALVPEPSGLALACLGLLSLLGLTRRRHA